MNTTAADFLKFFEGQQTYQTFHDKIKDIRYAHKAHGDIERHEKSLGSLNNQGIGIFFTVNETDGKGRCKENIVRIRAVFVDLDKDDSRPLLAKILSEDILEPSIVVQSSPNKFHCYWLVDDCPLDQFEPIQKALAAKFGGDDGVWDLPRVMRLPGFKHNKGEPFLTRVERCEGATYSIKQIQEQVLQGTPVKAQEEKPKADPRLSRPTGQAAGGRNNWLFKRGCSLRRKGNSVEDIRELLLVEAALCTPPLELDEVEQIIKQVSTYLSEEEKKKKARLPNPIKGVNNSDIANAKRLVANFGDSIRYAKGLRWMAWDGIAWRPDAEPDVIEYAKETAEKILDEAAGKKGEDKDALLAWAKQSQSIGHIRAMVSLAASTRAVRTDANSFDADPFLLNTEGGMIDLNNGKTLEHNRAKYCTRTCPVDIDAAQEAPKWEEFLEQITAGQPGLKEYLQRVAGYCLTGSVSEKCFFFCYGGGDNGKTVFIEVLHALMGDYSIALNASTLTKKKFGGGIPNDIARLYGPRLVTVSETSMGEEWNDSLIKDLTGGDVISARFLGKEFFDFKPQCKLIIRGNNKPEVTDSSAGMWRRIQLIPFEAQIAPDKQDKELRNKIVRKELPGVLYWALEGCIEWKRIGLSPPPCVQKASKEYREEMDIVGCFLEECTVDLPNGGASVKAKDLYSAYKTWAEDNDYKPLTVTAFGGALTHKNKKKVRNTKGWIYTSMQLNEPEKEGDEKELF